MGILSHGGEKNGGTDLATSTRIYNFANQRKNISDIMQIAYRKKFVNWEEDINLIVGEYFDDLYNAE